MNSYISHSITTTSHDTGNEDIALGDSKFWPFNVGPLQRVVQISSLRIVSYTEDLHTLELIDEFEFYALEDEHSFDIDTAKYNTQQTLPYSNIYPVNHEIHVPQVKSGGCLQGP